MISIGITSNGTSKELQESLREVYRRASDPSGALAKIGMELESRISARFETFTDPTGAPWAPWAPSTRASYPDNGNRRLLDRHGDMLDHLSHDVEGDSVRVGFVEPYAEYHEWGTKTMPRRGLLFADPDAGSLGPGDDAAVLEVIGLWLEKL